MGLGVLEVGTPVPIPGTVLLDEEASHSESFTGVLKHGRKKDAKIVLAPQPSDDPDDPLNWSSTKKHTVFFIIGLGLITNVAAPGPILTAGTVQIAMELNRSFTDITKLSGYMQLAAGAFGPFASALARKYGKRPVYLLSSLLAVVGCIIGECSHDYKTLVAARVIQGLATSAYEALIIPSIGDMFFLHERGPRIASALFVMNAIMNGVSIIAGPITSRYSWRYNFHILIPFVATQFLLSIFFLSETAYRRGISRIDTSLSEKEINPTIEQVEGLPLEMVKSGHLTTPKHTVEDVPAKPKTFFQWMALYNGTFVDDSIWKMLVACPVILVNVGAAYTVFGAGIIIVWYIAIALLSAVLLSAPPYLLSSGGVGHTYVSPLVGALIASIFMAVISDPLMRKVTQKNRGIFEAEFQLHLLAFGLITAIPGLVCFGYAIQHGLSLYLVCFLWALVSFGLSVITMCINSYGLAAFSAHSTEIFIMSMTFRNLFGYGVTNFIIDWWMSEGAMDVFSIMAGTTAGLSLLGLPIYIFGKKYRSFWSRHNFIKTLKLETDPAGT